MVKVVAGIDVSKASLDICAAGQKARDGAVDGCFTQFQWLSLVEKMPKTAYNQLT